MISFLVLECDCHTFGAVSVAIEKLLVSNRRPAVVVNVVPRRSALLTDIRAAFGLDAPPSWSGFARLV